VKEKIMGRGTTPTNRYGLADATHSVLDDSARYWQERAANQSPRDRLIEAFHPLTAMGSAMGGMRAAAMSGDKTGMALNTAAAIPLFAYMRAGRAADATLKGADALPLPAAVGLRGWRKNVLLGASDNAYSGQNE
jgi:hypothetical protein